MILIIESPIEIPTPSDRAIIIERFVTVPSVISCTCLFNTCTAGSANTTTAPTFLEYQSKYNFGLKTNIDLYKIHI